jgi:hypothetical protein
LLFSAGKDGSKASGRFAAKRKKMQAKLFGQRTAIEQSEKEMFEL